MCGSDIHQCPHRKPVVQRLSLPQRDGGARVDVQAQRVAGGVFQYGHPCRIAGEAFEEVAFIADGATNV